MRITESPRLIIREYHAWERQEAARLFSHAPTMVFWPAPWDEPQIDRWFEEKVEAYRGKGLGRFAVVLKANQEWIGDAGIFQTEVNGQREWDLGYIIHADHWGQGYGTEAAQALVDYAFREAGLERLVLHFAEDHHASRRVAQKTGAGFEKSFVNARNRGFTHELYALDRLTYQQQRRERLIRRLGGSGEKQNWLGLAASDSEKDRLLALETAVAVQEQIQPELLYWFCHARSFHHKRKLYPLLDATHREIADQAERGEVLPPLDGAESFRYFMASPDAEALGIQAAMEAQRVSETPADGVYPLPKGKMHFLKRYTQSTSQKMGDAKGVLMDIFNEARGY